MFCRCSQSNTQIIEQINIAYSPDGATLRIRLNYIIIYLHCMWRVSAVWRPILGDTESPPPPAMFCRCSLSTTQIIEQINRACSPDGATSGLRLTLSCYKLTCWYSPGGAIIPTTVIAWLLWMRLAIARWRLPTHVVHKLVQIKQMIG